MKIPMMLLPKLLGDFSLVTYALFLTSFRYRCSKATFLERLSSLITPDKIALLHPFALPYFSS